jgi:hypothetical protein
MSAREELESKVETIKQIQDSIDLKYREMSEIQDGLQGLVAQVLKEEDILNEAPWELRTLSNGGFYLDGGYHCDNPKDVEYHDNGVYRPKMFDLLCTNNWGDFHHDIREEGIRLYGTDGEVTLYIDEGDALKRVIKKYGLTVNYNQLNKRVAELEALVEVQKVFKEELEGE